MAYSDIVNKIGGIANDIFESGIQPIQKATNFLKFNSIPEPIRKTTSDNNVIYVEDIENLNKPKKTSNVEDTSNASPDNMLESEKKEKNLYDELLALQNSGGNSSLQNSTLKKLGFDANSIINSIGSKKETSSSKIDPWKVLEQAKKQKEENEKAKQQNQNNQQTSNGGNYTPKGGSEYWNSMVGKKPGNPYSYNNGASKGQCVWYVHGRFKEAFGKDLPFSGNGNGIYYSAPDRAKVSAKPGNLKGGMLVSYKYGTSSLGQKYGHVIYIEAVDGDTVYYTEGGAGYYNNGTIGNVKKTTRQGIMDGVSSSGAKIGSVPLGFVDLSKV